MAEGAITMASCVCDGRKVDHCILRELGISDKYMHNVFKVLPSLVTRSSRW